MKLQTVQGMKTKGKLFNTKIMSLIKRMRRFEDL
jgi:hypothetical protein